MIRRTIPVVAAAIVAMTVFASSCSEPAADASPTPEFGVASIVTLADRTPAGFEREAAAVKSVGADWIRIVINWNETEPERGDYRWGRIDGAIDAASRHGLKVLGLVAGPAPEWAAVYPNVPGSPPRTMSDFSSFAGELALRYRGRVKAWELWNEPNLRSYWIDPDPAAYANLLKLSYPKIKAADRSATVITGGVSPHFVGIDAGLFLAALYAHGARGYFDAVGAHPYTFPTPLGTNGWDTMTAGIRAVMDGAGDAGKRIWITEWGQPTGTNSIAVDEDTQAAVILKSMAFVHRQPKMGPMFLFTTKDWKADPSQADFNFGLYRFDFSPKPIVELLRDRYGSPH